MTSQTGWLHGIIKYLDPPRKGNCRWIERGCLSRSKWGIWSSSDALSREGLDETFWKFSPKNTQYTESSVLRTWLKSAEPSRPKAANLEWLSLVQAQKEEQHEHEEGPASWRHPQASWQSQLFSFHSHFTNARRHSLQILKIKQ